MPHLVAWSAVWENDEGAPSGEYVWVEGPARQYEQIQPWVTIYLTNRACRLYHSGLKYGPQWRAAWNEVVEVFVTRNREMKDVPGRYLGRSA